MRDDREIGIETLCGIQCLALAEDALCRHARRPANEQPLPEQALASFPAFSGAADLS